MALQLSQELIDLIEDPATRKVLATVDEDGIPHVVVKQSLHVGGDGRLHYLELLESSRTNRNLVRSLWFDRPVAIAVQGSDGRSFQIKGIPVKTHITGPLFQQHYVAVRQRLGDVDLAAVWVIEPQEVIDETFAIRQAREEAARPFFRHLDRLAKPFPEGVAS